VSRFTFKLGRVLFALQTASHDCDAADNKNEDAAWPRVAMKSVPTGIPVWSDIGSAKDHE
jgi:hypothetical protein